MFGKIPRMVLAVTAVTATATALTATPAWALDHNVFMPGVPSPSTQPVTGENSGSITAVTSSGGILTCVDTGASKALKATGTVRVGTRVLDPPPIGWVTGLTFSNCTVSGQIAVVTPQLPWSLSLPGPTASGATAAQLGGVRFTVSIPAMGCSVRFQGLSSGNGTINGVHANPASAGAAGTLSLPFSVASLHAIVLYPCPPGIVRGGDQLLINGVITLRGVNSTANEGPTIT